MWSFKKKECKEKKIIEEKRFKLAPGQSIEFGFHVAWRKDRDEVMIVIGEDKIFLTGKEDFIIAIKADNSNPIEVKIVPDFKNKKLDFIEVIDVNRERVNEERGPEAIFQQLDGREIVNIEERINTEKNLKKYKTRQILLIISGIILSGFIYTMWRINHNWIYVLLLLINIVLLIYNSYWFGKMFSISKGLKVELNKEK